jgi:hypothetical protein
MLVRTLRKPFSYLVPAQRFPSTVSVHDINGKLVKKLAELPSGETSPTGYDNVQMVPRSFDWRDDEPATITWCEPLDSGLIRKNVEYHDAVYALSAPFTGQPRELFKTQMRFRNILWGNETVALVSEGLTGKQTTRLHRYNPSTGELTLLIQRNTTDAYNDPGSPVMTKNKYGRLVVQTIENNAKLLMNNTTGASPKGDMPFLAKFDLNTKQSEIIWRCSEGVFEVVTDVLDAEKLVLLTRRETQTEVPNYFIRNLVLRVPDKPITSFKNPYPQLEGITKERSTTSAPMALISPATCTYPRDMIRKKISRCLC